MTCDAPAPSLELVSLRELHRRTGLSEPELRRLVREQGLPCYKVSKRRRVVLVSEFLEWLKGHRA